MKLEMTTYIQTVPLPTLGCVLRVSVPGHEPPGAPWRVGRDDRIEVFPRGSCAFVEAARGVAKDTERPVCFFPAYFCEGSLKPLREAGARIVFYRVARDLAPDWEDVRCRAKAERPDLFVLVHTFGYIQDATEAHVFANEAGCVVLEDGAHVLKPGGGLGKGGSLVLFSPHKLLALPPISLLSVPPSLAERVKSPYQTAWRRPDWKWLAKRLVQKGLVAFGGLGQRVKQRGGGFNGDADGEQPAIDYPREISALGARLLYAGQKDIEAVARRRRENFVTIANALDGMEDVIIPQPFSKRDQDTAPYAFPFFVGQDRVSAVYGALWHRGIPAQTWPDLPPEVLSQPEEFCEAHYWRWNLLLLPVHQSLTTRQMDRLVSCLKDVLSSSARESSRI